MTTTSLLVTMPTLHHDDQPPPNQQHYVINLTSVTMTTHEEEEDHHEHGNVHHHDEAALGIMQLLYILGLTLFIAIGVYIVAALITFEIRQRRRWFYQTNSNGQSVIVASPQVNFTSKRGLREWLMAEDSDTLAKKMRLCSIASPICAVALYCVQLGFELLHAFTENVHYCKIKSDLVFLLLTWSTSFISLLLWLRQRSMYAHHCRHQFMNSFRNFLNYSCIILIGIDFFMVPLIFSISRHLLGGESCHTDKDLHMHHIFITVIIIISFILHISLLYLFIAPLRHHKKNQEHGSMASEGRITRASRHLKKIIHHACIVSVWDLILDVAIFFTNLYFADKIEWAQALVDDFIIMMAVTVAIFTFINWRQRLCPFCTKKQRYPFSNQPSTTKASQSEAKLNVDRVKNVLDVDRVKKVLDRSGSSNGLVKYHNINRKVQVSLRCETDADGKVKTVIKNGITGAHYCDKI